MKNIDYKLIKQNIIATTVTSDAQACQVLIIGGPFILPYPNLQLEQ